MKSHRDVNDTGAYEGHAPHPGGLHQFKRKHDHLNSIEASKVIKQDQKQSILYKRTLETSRA